MEGQIDKQSKEYKRNVKEFQESLQSQVEKSYNDIEGVLDEILNQSSNDFKLKQITSQLSYETLKLQSNQLNFQNHNFHNQLIQEVNTVINKSIQQKSQQIEQCRNLQTIQQPKTIESTHQPNLKPFNYQFMDQYSIKQDQDCRALAINKDCSILVAACESQIKVFEFKQGMLKQVQLLSEHGNRVYTLNFMNRSNQFISGSNDSLIIIWARNQNNSWICQQKLIGHTNSINCLVLNNNEDIIISGSYDKTIKFWIKQDEWQCSQTITDHTNCVYGLSLNEQQNRVISCGEDKLILVIEQSQQNKQWILILKIQVEIE